MAAPLYAQSGPSAAPKATCPAASSSTDKTAVCPAPAPPQSVSEQFPYPGESTSASPPAAAPKGKSGDPGKDFPYPGDPAANSSNPSSSSSSSSSSSRANSNDLPPEDAPTAARGRRILPKVKNLQSDDDREAEDLQVAKYYRQAGDLNAAYLRVKDAVKLMPGDSEAHYALADVAHRLGKKDEAVREYAAYLKLDPDGDRVKSAKKALASLQ